MVDLDDIDRQLVDRYQRDFPLVAAPFSRIAADLGLAEDDVIARLRRLKEIGAISRVGAVVRPNVVGVSTLAAMAVSPERLNEIAAIVSAQSEVNHNYEREHALNLWFVAVAKDASALEAALERIERKTGFTVVDLPLVEAYHIDLGFPLQ